MCLADAIGISQPDRHLSDGIIVAVSTSLDALAMLEIEHAWEAYMNENETKQDPATSEEEPGFLEEIQEYSWTQTESAIEEMLLELAEEEEERQWVEYMAPLFEELDQPSWYK
jgi:L-rhamnose mutarotase